MHPSLEQYLAALHAKRRASATLKVVRQDLTHFMTWWEHKRGRSFDPVLLRHEDFRDWRVFRQCGDGAAPATINRGLASLRGYCRWALAGHLLVDDPMADVKDVPMEPLAPRSLPAEAIDALLRQVRAEHNAILRVRDEALLTLLTYVGLRVQEVCDLQLRLLRRYLDIVRCPQGLPAIGSDQEREKLVVGVALTVKGQPTRIGITQRVIQRMVQRLGQQAAQQLRAEAKLERDITRSEHLEDLARRISTVTPHMLRHSLARRMLERGAQLPEVQRVLGHSRLSTTGVYLTPSEEEVRAALRRAGI
jgi:site-specific recombinase XerD